MLLLTFSDSGVVAYDLEMGWYAIRKLCCLGTLVTLFQDCRAGAAHRRQRDANMLKKALGRWARGGICGPMGVARVVYGDCRSYQKQPAQKQSLLVGPARRHMPGGTSGAAATWILPGLCMVACCAFLSTKQRHLSLSISIIETRSALQLTVPLIDSRH